MTGTKRTTTEEARRVGDEIGVDWDRFDLEQFLAGMDVEYEHGSHDAQTDVTGDDPIITGKIALAHMKEFPDYYERLARMESEAEREGTALGAPRSLLASRGGLVGFAVTGGWAVAWLGACGRRSRRRSAW